MPPPDYTKQSLGVETERMQDGGPLSAEAKRGELAALFRDDDEFVFMKHSHLLLLNSIIFHFSHLPYPLNTLQIIRAKSRKRVAGGSKVKDDVLKDSWYAAIVAPDADHASRGGFKVLVTGPSCTGSDENSARKEALWGLRDRLEEMTHEKLTELGRRKEEGGVGGVGGGGNAAGFALKGMGGGGGAAGTVVGDLI